MISRNKRRKIRHLRIRKKIKGTLEIPRLSIFKSNKMVSVQLIDDTNGVTLLAISTKKLGLNKDVASCKKLGQEIALRAKEKGIRKVVFDKSGYKYHGKLAAIATGARESGLII